MDRLWAPWRSVYVGKDQGSQCIFCEKLNASADQDREDYVLYRGNQVFVILNIFPYNSGHLLVAPKRHVGDIEDLDPEEMRELFSTTQYMVKVLRSAFKPDGFNVGINLGKVAGAGIPGHLHIHVVPRWNGDNNFMPVLGDVRVISEALDTTLQKLKETMDKE
ncbi:Diadenosine tetraphosphate (Ap4A) hydrolase [Desulfotomaculum arcticum]|uniref:Diadenosine tetraphosphate (Ap4A) hydrolase n=1 Tax=Desulfotruncus arcticus DSM 17038 TaxID=1121424 RepID=A0A1I2TKY1_9FIRM|nr:HIT domain-containing protein [Desulfotruncus arcticus]SFG65518.1 Diadenosine tetraphosphate (Ap4A) hydrolase [Desulfotomaculum arcticum] [Desulfotruncus arcticus DSM 17038]